jgi:hypothetical protein
VDKLRLGSTQASVDLNNDLVAGTPSIKVGRANSIVVFEDLFLTIDHNNEPKFRIYELPITKLTLIKEYDPPAGVAIYHLSTFADIGTRPKACRLRFA